MTAWLLKTEPRAFSFNDLVAAGVEPWDGVSSPAALKHLRSVEPGQCCVIYHTGNERQVVGLASVERAAYPDPEADDPRLVVIDVRVGERLKRPVTLAELKRDHRFVASPLVREGRLSVVPLTDEQYGAILELGQEP